MSFTTSLRTPRAVPARACGYTLVELVLAIGIVAIIASAATSSYRGYRTRVQTAQAVTDVSALQSAIGSFTLDNHRLPATLDELGPAYANMRDPWGSLYQYASHADTGRDRFRTDPNLVPINTDFDLWSVGPDRDSKPGITAPVSRDDIVRAANGKFVGVASEYTP
jgi:general secretion pathway protein G